MAATECTVLVVLVLATEGNVSSQAVTTETHHLCLSTQRRAVEASPAICPETCNQTARWEKIAVQLLLILHRQGKTS